MNKRNPRILALFDVDGTLTPARKTATAKMRERLSRLRSQITIGVVGGSDLCKQKEQLGEDGTKNVCRYNSSIVMNGDVVVCEFDYSFSENGLVAYHAGELIGKTSLRDKYSDAQLNRFLDYVLKYIASLQIPVKRGTFVEFRIGMINISPIGRNCSQEERDAFEQYDNINQVRKQFVEVLRREFPDYNFAYSIGGQISFDVFPKGWDKTFCLQYVDPKAYDEIHFFGDKTQEGGNDYEIFHHERTIGHSVGSPEDTLRILHELFP